MRERVPLPEEAISDMDAVVQYDRGARYYMMPEYRYFVRKIRRAGIKIGRVLDIGTGSGRLAMALAGEKNCDFDIVALDISENMIKKARENARKYGLEGKIEFVVGNAAALPFPPSSFDLVISYASLHHWLKPVAVFNEIARVGKEGGKIIIRDNRRVYQNPLWRAAIWGVSRFMNKRHRENWPKVIQSSYTIPEARDILGQSMLNNCRLSIDFLFLDLCIESAD